MNSKFLYISVIFIWSTTWFAIKLQVNQAPTEVSVLYRSLLAAILLFVYSKLTNKKFSFSWKDHIYFCFLGIAMFSFHYFFLFHALSYLASGVVAVIFSTASFFNVLNNYLFFRTSPTRNTFVGLSIGFFGLVIFFSDVLAHTQFQNETFFGVGMALAGAYLFSLGSIISKRNQQKRLDNTVCLTMGVIYGTLLLALYIFLSGTNLVFPSSIAYWGSVSYLATFGAAAFFLYFHLIKNVGPNRAGYASIVIPIMALCISTVLEDYVWTRINFIGLTLIALGSVYMAAGRHLGELTLGRLPFFSNKSS